MRILVSKKDKKLLLSFLKEKYSCNSLIKLSNKLNISKSTLDNYFYSSSYIPESIIPKEIINKLTFIDKKGDNWGRIKGGKNTYKIVIEKYGQKEIKNRQLKGLKNSLISRKQNTKPLNLDITNQKFLELYGALLGDGWLSKLNFRGKTFYLVGISGNLSKDKEYIIYLKKSIYELLGRSPYIKERPKSNSLEINLGHKKFLEFLNNELNFPIGEKLNLKINNKIYDLNYDLVKYTIRGIFDTDGCVYFDKTPANKPYPCISISMKSPILMQQLKDMLLNQGFKVTHYINKTGVEQIKLKGSKQLNKWMNEIGSSNPRNLSKLAPVAQSG